MIEMVIFSIPVYYRTQEEFLLDFKKKKEKYIKSMKEDAIKRGLGFNKKNQDYYENLTYGWDFLCWKYNDIIAWIDIYFEDMHLQADIYKIKAKRVTTLMKKREYRYIYKLAKICDIEDHSNKEIANKIKDFLSNLDLAGYFKKYYIDTEIVFNTIDFIDFRKLRDSILREK